LHAPWAPGYSDEVAKNPKKKTGRPGGTLGTSPRVPWRLFGRVLLVLVLVPLVLAPLYKVVNPVSTLMIWERLTTGPIARDWVTFDDMSKWMVASVIVSEDSRYCAHRGVDWQALGTVIDTAEETDKLRGASTIAMQTVKNLFLWTSRSYVRKALEVPLALYGDLVLGKRRLIEIYLNIAEFGPGIFGVEAAARHYFGRSAKALSAGQAALLAASLPSPATRDPAHPSALLRALARTVAARAHIAGPYIVCLYP
jgi:monofunctional biosynthetic peptidoglycan transglycosylase